MSTSSFKFLQFGFLLTAARGALAGWFSWLERHPIHPRVSGLIPVRAHTGGNLLMFLTSMFLSPLLFPLSLKSGTYLWMRIKKRKEKAARGILAPPPTPWDSHAHQQGPHCLSHGPLLNLEALDLLLQLPQLLPCRDLGMDTAGKGVKWSPSFAPSGWSLTPLATSISGGVRQRPSLFTVAILSCFSSVLGLPDVSFSVLLDQILDFKDSRT